MLTLFYAKMGNPPDFQGAVAAMATSLATKAAPEAVQAALDRCESECRFPVRLPDIFQRIPGTEAGDGNGEMRAAWDVLVAHVRKWGRWSEDYSGAYFEKGAPAVLSERILDVVRRTGGPAVYLGMTFVDREDGKASFPFVQARFFEEYKAWSKVESIDRARLISAVPNFAQLTEQKSLTAAIEPTRPAPKLVRSAAAEAQSPQKARIMKAIENAGKAMR
jgi:hypothetical protein